MEPVMTQSENSLASYWSNFVTADGWSYTLGRLALSLAISVVFFPFGLVIVAALFSILLPITDDLRKGELPRTPDPKLVTAAKRLFVTGIVVPTLFGAVPALLSPELRQSAAQLVLDATSLSYFDTSLVEWRSFYGPEDRRRGPQYVVSAAALMYSLPLLFAYYFPGLRELFRRYSNAVVFGVIPRRQFVGATILGLLSFASPVLFCVWSPTVSHDLGVVGPGTQLSYFVIPLSFLVSTISAMSSIALTAILFAAKLKLGVQPRNE
jgi:hypothetical protein